MTIIRSVAVLALAGVFEIGGAWLVWQAAREGRAWWWAGLGIIALDVYGLVATVQPDTDLGPVLAADGGVFIVGSLAQGMGVDGYRPSRGVVLRVRTCLAGVAMIMYASRPRSS